MAVDPHVLELAFAGAKNRMDEGTLSMDHPPRRLRGAANLDVCIERALEFVLREYDIVRKPS